MDRAGNLDRPGSNLTSQKNSRCIRVSLRSLRHSLANFAVKAFVLDLQGEEIMKAKSRRCQFVLALMMVCIPTSLPAQGQGTSFDLVITHGHIIDGTGSPWYSGDVGIRDGKI